MCGMMAEALLHMVTLLQDRIQRPYLRYINPEAGGKRYSGPKGLSSLPLPLPLTFHRIKRVIWPSLMPTKGTQQVM